METKKARIVIVGGGFGGLFTALNLEGAGDVSVVSNADHFLFTPMLYEYLSGEVEEWHIAPKYRELLDEGVKLVRDEVVNIDLKAQTVALKHRNESLISVLEGHRLRFQIDIHVFIANKFDSFIEQKAQTV